MVRGGILTWQVTCVGRHSTSGIFLVQRRRYPIQKPSRIFAPSWGQYMLLKIFATLFRKRMSLCPILECAFVIAYGRDDLTNTPCYKVSCRKALMRSPAVSGAQSYRDLVLAAKNEEKRQSQLRRRQQQTPKQSEPQQPLSWSRRPSSEIKCHTCGEMGHYQY